MPRFALEQAYEKTLAPYHIADVGTGLVRPSVPRSKIFSSCRITIS